MDNFNMGDHLGSMYFVFLWLVEILGKLGKFAKFSSSAGISENLNYLELLTAVKKISA